MAKRNKEEEMSVKDVFEGKSILITGASGFLGKVLVEKLLYSIPALKNIYLLIRPLKNDTNPKDRLSRLLEVCHSFVPYII